MTHNSCASVVLLAAILILPTSDLLAKDSKGTRDKIAKSGEFVIGYRTDASPSVNIALERAPR